MSLQSAAFASVTRIRCGFQMQGHLENSGLLAELLWCDVAVKASISNLGCINRAIMHRTRKVRAPPTVHIAQTQPLP